jgi:hypothetical protein
VLRTSFECAIRVGDVCAENDIVKECVDGIFRVVGLQPCLEAVEQGTKQTRARATVRAIENEDALRFPGLSQHN